MAASARRLRRPVEEIGQRPREAAISGFQPTASRSRRRVAEAELGSAVDASPAEVALDLERRSSPRRAPRSPLSGRGGASRADVVDADQAAAGEREQAPRRVADVGEVASAARGRRAAARPIPPLGLGVGDLAGEPAAAWTCDSPGPIWLKRRATATRRPSLREKRVGDRLHRQLAVPVRGHGRSAESSVKGATPVGGLAVDLGRGEQSRWAAGASSTSAAQRSRAPIALVA